mmetsp:Transcript_17713/g.36770  ORF Transcript_17713/g.36770 Transcript_17713/m.36770 type:complete len:236 (+) Transcript_17713:306-1013(+)
MSEVLTIKTGAKRPFEAMDTSSPPRLCSSPHGIFPSCGDSIPQPCAAAAAAAFSTLRAGPKRIRSATGFRAEVAAIGTGGNAADSSDPKVRRMEGSPGRENMVPMSAEEDGSSSDKAPSGGQSSSDSETGAKSTGLSGRRRESLASWAGSELIRHLPRRFRGRNSHMWRQTQKIFSVQDVQEIVTNAVAEKEAKLRAEFETCLNEVLAEQYQNFSKFNQDYITRQFRGREVSYLS